jgi:hypothetical protein
MTFGAEFLTGEKVTVSNPLTRDSYIAGVTVKVTKKVEGDLVVAGGEIFLENEITQDLIVAGGTVNIQGTIGDDVRVAGGQVFIDGNITGDLIVFGGSVNMSSTSNVKGSLIVMAGNISTGGNIEGASIIKGEQIVLDGNFAQEVDARGEIIETTGVFNAPTTLVANEKLDISDNTRFLDNVSFWTPKNRPDFTSFLENESEVRFDTGLEPKWGEAKSMPKFKEGMQMMKRGMFVSGLILNAFLIGLLMLLLRPWLEKVSVRFQTTPIRQFGIGWTYFALVPVLGFLLLITIIGIPLALMLFTAYGLGFLFIPSLTAIITAQWINRVQKLNLEKISLYLLALLIYTLVALLESISFLGVIIAITLSLLAVGSMVSEIFAKRNSNKTPKFPTDIKESSEPVVKTPTESSEKK